MMDVADAKKQIVEEYIKDTGLTDVEKEEVHRIAAGVDPKTAAGMLSMSHETIRTRRKRIYKKLDVNGTLEILADLLHLAAKKYADMEKTKEEYRAAALR